MRYQSPKLVHSEKWPKMLCGHGAKIPIYFACKCLVLFHKGSTIAT